MRRALFIFLAILSLLIYAPGTVYAETIDSFDATYSLRSDGRIDIRERIAYDFSDTSRHGIYRTIPYMTKNSEGKKIVMNFSEFRLLDDKGVPYNFSKTKIDDTYSLKIGDAERLLQGVHLYDIAYTVSGGMRYFSDHDELYWNVTGNGWEVPMLKASATIVLPQDIKKTDVTLACYTGISGSTEKACNMTYSKGKVVIKTLTPLQAGEGLTVVVGIPKNIIAVLEPTLYVPYWETRDGKIILAAIMILALFWYVLYPLYLPIRWWVHGRDPKPLVGEVTAWFDAPKTKRGRTLTPGETGTLVDEKADMQDIISTVVHLAQRGYVRILEPKKGDFSLERLRDSVKESPLEAYEKTLLTGLFASGDTIDFKNGSLVSVAQDTKNALYDAALTEKFFDKNPQSTRTAYGVLAFFALCTGNIPLLLSALIFGLHMPKKTLYGSTQAAVAKSLKNFLTSQERQLAFQAKNQMFFEKLLPYAIAFGVEKIWAERFRDIAMKPPSYYQGYSMSNFNSINFANSLSSTGSKIAAAATPVSSSTGHSSGFSGGFSGGGGGGGGGGSW